VLNEDEDNVVSRT